MVALNYMLEIGNEKSLDTFDDITHIAFGDNTSSVQQTNTTLGNELLRNILISKTKDTLNNEYEFVGKIYLPQLNNEYIGEIGLFNDSVSGDMGLRLVLNPTILKTDDDELVFTITIKIQTTNK